MKLKPEHFKKHRSSCYSRRKVIPLPSTSVSVEVSVPASYTASDTDHFWSEDAVDGFVLAQWFLGELDIY